MAATMNGSDAPDFAPVLSALATMQANVGNAQKGQAHAFLEKFQKSSEAWPTVFNMLQSQQTTDEAKLFAATTLKGKVIYDFYQVPANRHDNLRDTILQSLIFYAKGPKPIRTVLCVCLANLAIQMLEWKDVLYSVSSALGLERITCILEFIHVLPEEVTEGRKINLSEVQLRDRTLELLEENGAQVLKLLIDYAQSSPDARKNPLLMDCITSWIREVPLNDIVDSPLMDVVMDAVQADTSFDSAVETLCAIFKETREVDENMEIIDSLYPRLATLQPRIQACAEEEDWDTLKGITRIFAEAGEAWVVLIARQPQRYSALVECILECCAQDKERDALSTTFNFWFELKQYITLDRYIEARGQFFDTYSKLVDIMIGHLEYPESNTSDYFDGDREAEEKFRELRHHMGDVLKDCCEVIGATECLNKPYQLIQAWVAAYGPQATNSTIPKWQKLEAPLFSMRAMGRMIPSDESVMLRNLVPLIVQIPDHPKVRFQAVMALGRYTEWTARHPETLKDQLDFIMACFSHSDKEVVRAAALSFKFFCNDCAELLKGFMPQLQHFYEANLDALPQSSQEEITEGIGSVLNMQPLDTLYDSFKLCCDPVVKRLMTMAQAATEKEQKLAVADRLNLVTIFISTVNPHVDLGQRHPVVQYCNDIFPYLGGICERFVDFVPIVERVCRCWRYMVLTYKVHAAPLLQQLAEKLAAGFTASRQGCFLWATDAVVREFSDVSEHVSEQMASEIYRFYEQQARTFLHVLNDLPPEEVPDVIEDFFRLSSDVQLYHPDKFLLSPLLGPVLSAAETSLTLLKEEPLIATLHFLRDFLGYGTDFIPASHFDSDGQYRNRSNPAQIQNSVRAVTLAHGNNLVQRCMAGMMVTFPADCFPDASGVLLALFQLLPNEVAGWTAATVRLLPGDSIAPEEQERLMRNIQQRIESGETRKIRSLLQDFTNSYRRRNVAPREGLGRLEATRFRFAG